MTTINDLTAPLITQIFSLLSARECCRALCAQKSWRSAIEDDRLWEVHCAEEFSLQSPVAFRHQKLPSYRRAFIDWKASIGKYGPLGTRAAVAWQKIEDVLAQQQPSILASLRPGAEETDLDALSEHLGVPVPDAFRVIYRFHDGQLFAPSFAFWGLFGWFNVYHAVHSTSMLPLSKVTLLTPDGANAIFASASPEAFQDRGPPLNTGGWTEQTISILEHRQMYTDMKSGDVFAFANRQASYANAKLLQDRDKGSDHVLKWFEAYADALHTGYFQVADGWDLVREDYGEVEALERVPRDSFRGVSIIPRLPPGQVEAITCGIEVTASVVFLPDNPMSRSPAVHEYAYSIQFTLLPEADQLAANPHDTPLKSAQLLSRHWAVLDERGQCTDVVEGEAVIGKYPHLTQAKPSFEYQSCINLTLDKTGSMTGHFTFVKGSIADPIGPEFEVKCPRFYLQQPEWIF